MDAAPPEHELEPVTADPPGPRPGLRERLHARAELLATVLLTVAAVATAWSSYQAARWSGVQAIDFSEASAARVEATPAATWAGQETQVDVLTFTEWVDAFAEGETRLARFYFDRFREEFKPAVDAWIATRQLKTAGAPPTPFVMPEYRVARQAEAARLEAEAHRAGLAAREANQRSDNYVLAVVLFAVSLFFAGISTKLSAQPQRLTVLALGYALFLGTVAWILTFPVTVSV